MSDIRVILVAAVIGPLAGVTALAESATPASDRTACAAAALKDYSAAILALLSGGLSVKVEIAQRRLQEEYCLRHARCLSNPAVHSLEYTAKFSRCLTDETLQHYDAVPR